MRVTSWWPLLVIIFPILYLIGAWWVARKQLYHKRKGLSVALLAVAFIGMIALQLLIDPWSIKVDRWSALTGPISYLLAGKYPYMAPTHLGGFASPFPVWQVIHIPFYLLGNVALSFFVALILFIYTLYKTSGVSYIGIAALMLTSPAVWHEAIVRSDLFTNMMLVASVTVFMYKALTTDNTWLERHWLAVAVVCGLLLSTRLFAAVPLFILCCSLIGSDYVLLK